jgi:hypothetical protein
VEKAGVSAPFGFFDPLGFYKDKTIRQKKKLRECESCVFYCDGCG